MKALYSIAGISRQAHHKQLRRSKRVLEEEQMVLRKAVEVKRKHPRMGTKKLYKILEPGSMGRDRFIDLLLSNGLGVKQQRSLHRTTFSLKHLRYENLITGREFTAVNQCWVSDITYIRLREKFYYLVLIMDVYSKELVGWSLNRTLQARGNVEALKMALRRRTDLKGLIHHSDRGGQYGSDAYLGLLQSKGIQVSMGAKAWENAHAERINGILKQEYIEPKQAKDYEQLNRIIKESINLYHKERPHWSLPGLMTPYEFIKKSTELSTADQYKLVIKY